ncbi:hypothetical protein Q9R38_26115 [Priestia aryabhattai]|nr:hypothetical protein [Priestia aryabhattai]MDT0150020.1 hypothetical protein [Priestia aryabhattai]MDT0155590.1 hypothetical protein [Priestia aryabhattai]
MFNSIPKVLKKVIIAGVLANAAMSVLVFGLISTGVLELGAK